MGLRGRQRRLPWWLVKLDLVKLDQEPDPQSVVAACLTHDLGPVSGMFSVTTGQSYPYCSSPCTPRSAGVTAFPQPPGLWLPFQACQVLGKPSRCGASASSAQESGWDPRGPIEVPSQCEGLPAPPPTTAVRCVGWGPSQPSLPWDVADRPQPPGHSSQDPGLPGVCRL